MSVRSDAVHWWYGLFGFLTVYLTVTNTLTEVARTNAAGWQEVQDIATVKLTEAGAASLIASTIITEVGHMVFATMLRNRQRRKAFEEGEKAGEERNQLLWEAWNQRRLEAAARGEPFTEPPPTHDNANGASH